jgi:formamidopyrimidine-DNA glycosylase
VPELPDVECFQRFLQETSLNRRITGVEVFNRRVLDRISPVQLRRAVVGRSFRSTRRHGKYLLTEVDDSAWLVLHFGMTGSLDYGRPPRPGPYDRVVFALGDGYRLAYVCPRLFGRITLARSAEDFIEERSLGPDAMHVSAEEFARRIGRSKATVKSCLMNQSCVAGIGNLYSDEILFQSGLHPALSAHQLAAEQLERLYRSTRKVLQMAIRRKADPWAMPPSYLLPHREPGGCCPACKIGLVRQTIAGRTTYWCPKCQRK